MSNPFSVNVPDRKSDKVVKEAVPEAATEGGAVGSAPARTAVVRQPGASFPALGMDEVSCRTCQYLDFKGISRTEASGGECRRHAPVPGADQIASWRRVTGEGWCREWKSGVSDEDMVKMARAIADRQAAEFTGGFQGAKVRRRSAEPPRGTGNRAPRDSFGENE